ncbi:MAG: MBL fold metallo-hydrolase [Archaeoglobus sp.]|nr:MBL fold metallo-hydrolase [Archaeoglobus sp.]
MNFKPVWFDSMGAKSSCILVKTDIDILIDPGAAIMHPGFPAPQEKKIEWYEKALEKINQLHVDVTVISHYHYDHFVREAEMYSNSILFAKNPNEFINDSQRKRAEAFYERIFEFFGVNLKDSLEKPLEKEYEDPLLNLESAGKDFGDYQKRREEILEKGRRWFEKRVEKWKNYKRIPEVKSNHFELKFAEGRNLKIGKTRLRFTEPLFHGIEYSRVGWVFSTVIEYRGMKLIHTSDLNGPIIEDYAEWIVEENPEILVLDGPMTYMLGYTLNLINFRRTIENALRILKETDTELIIYDHHLPREPKFKERTKEVWDEAKRKGKNLLTAAEYLGEIPAVLRVEDWQS